MNYGRFLLFNVVGGVSWVVLCLLGGWLFGNLPWVKEHFEHVIYAIIVISVLPIVVEVARGWLAARKGHSELVEATTLESTHGDDPAPR